MKMDVNTLRLRLRYDHLTDEGCLTLLGSLLKDGEKSRYDELRNLILECGIALRPEMDGNAAISPEDRRWGHWAAMALRSFPALALRAKENSVSNVRGWLAYDNKLLQGLLFGDRIFLDAILSEGFESTSWRSKLPLLTPGEEQIISIIQYPIKRQNLSERQVHNWTRALWPEWSEEIHKRLRLPFFHHVIRLISFLSRRHQSTGDRADDELKNFVARFKENGPEWAYGAAAMYLAERDHLYSRVLRHASRVLPLAGATIACMVPALLSPQGSMIRLILLVVSLALLVLGVVKMTLSVLLLLNYNSRYVAHLAILASFEREETD